jgi:nucleoside-diphosphate-sugar epimerase
MDLGLAGLEIDALADVTHVFHLAALQSAHADARLLEAVNVDGVRNLLSLARELPRLQRFVHFSSCFVAGDRQGVILEEELDDVPATRTPYEDSKMRGEKLARAAMADLPITIIRPSVIVGDSTTGEIDRFDGVYAMGILVVTSPIGVPLPLPGPGLGPLHVVPVDYLTRAVIHLADDPRAIGRTFHVVDPNPLSARMVYALVAQKAGKKVPALPRSLSSSLALSAAVRRASSLASQVASSIAGSLSSTFPGAQLDRVKRSAAAVELFERFVVYNAANTTALLAGTDIVCPRFDTYVDALVRYVRDSLREERSRAVPVVADPLA